MNSTVRRALAGAVAWTAGATVAVGVGMLALSFVGTGLTASSLTGPALAVGTGGASATPAASPAPTADPTATGSPAPAVPGPPRLLVSNGGSVLAVCLPAGAYLRSWSPAAGYGAIVVVRGPTAQAVIQFRNRTVTVQMVVRCRAGVPLADLDSGHDPDVDDSTGTYRSAAPGPGPTGTPRPVSSGTTADR